MSRPEPAPPSPAPQTVLSVSQLTAEIKNCLEGAFPGVWVSGEISNFSRPQSGHCYFTLKDDAAQLRAVVWRNTAARLPGQLHDGLEVICQGDLDLYPPRGTYQLVVRQLLPKGLGALELKLRQLREKLSAEGLFDPSRKRPLPPFPRTIGLVTSPTGAAVHDFLQVLRRRWPLSQVLIFPVRVQGAEAVPEIVQALKLAQRMRTPPQVLVLARGGGSLEDLWAFQEEAVVRAIAACTIPLVSAIGHEIDVTLSDLAADVRALTPSEAAELVVPSVAEIRGQLQSAAGRLVQGLHRRARLAQARLDALAQRPALRRPLDGIHLRQQRLDELQLRLERATRQRLEAARSRADRMAAQLGSLSPLGVLERGYSLTRRLDNGQLVRRAGELQIGQAIVTHLAQGQAISRVESLELPDDALSPNPGLPEGGHPAAPRSA